MTLFYESAPYKLLLVDDQRSVLESYTLLIKEEAPNIRVTQASTGKEAIECFHDINPDCVLLDHELPDMNALQVISAMQDGPNLTVPVIVFSSHSKKDLDLELMEAGATDFFDKREVSPELLRRTIFRAIVRFRYSSSQHYYEQAQQALKEKSAIEKATSEERKKLKSANKQLEFMAMHDSLTGLANRVMLIEHLTRAISSSKRNEIKFYVLFIDLDRFKNVNDSLGHSGGDILLLEVVRRIRKAIRIEDVMARVGGDEFVIVLDGCNNESSAFAACKKINEVVAEKYVIDGNDIFISASVGISAYPADGETPDDLLENADSAMYSAKRNGKNTFILFNNKSNHAPKQNSFEPDLHNAIDKGELSIYYQPKVDLKSGNIYGVEALLRWHSKNHGPISPTAFIPIAEESDLIIRLGKWVREEAAKQLNLWKNSPFSHFHIAINVSSREFSKVDLLEQLKHLRDNYQINPELLELEITERTIVEQVNLKSNHFNKIKDLGCGLSIDDFGTGYSSLSYLKKIPIDELKIDRSFISEDIRDRAITETIINMAKNLGIRSIAEGVEGREQLDYLVKVGCDQIQGFFFSKPLPIQKFEDWASLYSKDSHAAIAPLAQSRSS